MMRRAPSSDRQAGFSLMEAIIALVIASMVLSAILPVASRSVTDNIRIGMKGLDAFSMSIDEQAFRSLADASVAPPTEPLKPPARTTVAAGDAKGFDLDATSPVTLRCVPAGESVAVRIGIEPAADGKGGSLVCASGAGLRRDLMVWTDDSVASLSYSEDGRVWTPVWPQPGSALALPPRVISDIGGPPLESVVAPYVRFRLERGGQVQLNWIARFGQPGPQQFRIQDFFGDANAATPSAPRPRPSTTRGSSPPADFIP